METQATTPSMPQPTPASENADKNPKLDSYDAADNAYNSRYKKPRRSYATVRKIAKKFRFFRARQRGATIREAAAITGVDKTTPYRWCEQDPEFAQAWRESRNTLLQNLEIQAFHQALHCDRTLLMFLLKSYKPETFNQRPHSGKEQQRVINFSALADKYRAMGLGP